MITFGSFSQEALSFMKILLNTSPFHIALSQSGPCLRNVFFCRLGIQAGREIGILREAIAFVVAESKAKFCCAETLLCCRLEPFDRLGLVSLTSIAFAKKRSKIHLSVCESLLGSFSEPFLCFA